MKLLEKWEVVRGEAGTERAICTFPAVLRTANRELLLAYRTGSAKDSEDETIEVRRSTNGGQAWSYPRRCFDSRVQGKKGSLKLCYLTELRPGQLLAASMWVDREAYPGKPLFNAETEGCLPMAIVLADSRDNGESWTKWRVMPMPAEIGPPSLTSPVLRLKDGTLVMSIETNKNYGDASKWMQRVVYFWSKDQGKTWGEMTTVSEDTTGRIYNWDQRAGVDRWGRIATFTWTYDSETKAYVNIHRRISGDGGKTWTPPEDLGITDQAGRPAILFDGGVVLPWVDRFKDQAIKVRHAKAIDAPFTPESELVIYKLGETKAAQSQSTGELLAEMGLWTFGLPYAEVLPEGDVLVMYYAGDSKQMGIHAARVLV